MASDRRQDDPNSAAAVDALRERLAAAGCRPTTQRLAVLAHLHAVDTHPTADEVFRAVRVGLPRISLATVYNTLETLVAAGLAHQLPGQDGAARYDGRTEAHYHLRDIETGEVRDLPVEFDEQLLARLDPELVARLATSGFAVDGYRLEVLGRFRR